MARTHSRGGIIVLNFTVDVLQMRDANFNIGLKMGKHIKNSSLLKTFESITKPEIDEQSMKSIFLNFAPHLLDELEGLSQGLEIPYHQATALLSGYDMPKVGALGCSAMMMDDYYVRNYDFSPDLYDGLFSLIQPGSSFATAGYNLQLIGRHEGVNQEGLVAGLHFVSNYGYTKGVSAWTATRMILDCCATTEEAVHMLKEIPHAACYNFSLGDKQGNHAVVEASPDNVGVRRDSSVLSCVNHFQEEKLQNKNKPSIEHSVKRDHHLVDLASQSKTHLEMFNYFKDIRSPLFFTDYDDLFGTLHTFSYSYHDSRILTSIAQSEQVLDVNFQGWVEGKNIVENTLKGVIEDSFK